MVKHVSSAAPEAAREKVEEQSWRDHRAWTGGTNMADWDELNILTHMTTYKL